MLGFRVDLTAESNSLHVDLVRVPITDFECVAKCRHAPR